jgi:hypothetical protein
VDGNAQTPWWEREPPAASGEEKSRSARAIVAGMSEVLRPHIAIGAALPPLHDISRQATAKRCEAIKAIMRRCDVAALEEVLDHARSRAALGSVPDLSGEGHPADALTGGDVDASDLPDGAPSRSHVLVTPSSRELDTLELVRRAAVDAGIDPEGGAA